MSSNFSRVTEFNVKTVSGKLTLDCFDFSMHHTCITTSFYRHGQCVRVCIRPQKYHLTKFELGKSFKEEW